VGDGLQADLRRVRRIAGANINYANQLDLALQPEITLAILTAIVPSAMWPFKKSEKSDEKGEPDKKGEPDVEVTSLPVLIQRGNARRSAWTRFCHTLERVGLYSITGAAISVLLLLAEKNLLKTHPTAQEIVKHLAGAFMVSAIAIFAYEWGSEVKRAADLAASLVKVLQSHIDKITEADARVALANSLQKLAGEGSEALTKQLEDFADALKQLAGGSDWAAPGYRAFIREYHNYLTANVQRLADVSRRVREKHSGGNPFDIIIPTAHGIADAMVNSTLAELAKRGGHYYAVSDATTWKLLQNFAKSQQTAWTRGVNIHRVFVLGRRADERLKVAEVAEVIAAHYKNAEQSGGAYEIRMISTEDYGHSPVYSLRGAEHFGIFAPNGEMPLVFKVEDDEFSRFTVDVASTPMLQEFDRLWKSLPKMTGAEGSTTIRDHLLAYGVNRLPREAHYRGISDIASWREGVYERFIAASKHAMLYKDVRMQRLFVIDNNVEIASSEILHVLHRHHTLETQSGKAYEWRVCRRDLWSPDLQKHIPIGLFATSHEGAPDEIVRERSQEDEPWLVEVPEESYKWFQEQFDTVWTNLKSLNDSIRLLFPDRADEILRLIDHPETFSQSIPEAHSPIIENHSADTAAPPSAAPA
jgi:hypothetical protein